LQVDLFFYRDPEEAKELEEEAIDGNKSLYLVFVGVFFLSILDCF
jgi:hypothetical protein